MTYLDTLARVFAIEAEHDRILDDAFASDDAALAEQRAWIEGAREERLRELAVQLRGAGRCAYLAAAADLARRDQALVTLHARRYQIHLAHSVQRGRRLFALNEADVPAALLNAWQAGEGRRARERAAIEEELRQLMGGASHA